VRHRHSRAVPWSDEAVLSCLERGGLVQGRGLMRAAWADQEGPTAARLEKVLADVDDQAHEPPERFEGSVDEATWSMWRAHLRDAREWQAAKEATS
jgi:hypothetical protein